MHCATNICRSFLDRRKGVNAFGENHLWCECAAVSNVCKTYLFPNSQNSSRFQGVNWDPPKHVRFTPDKYDPPFPWSCDVSSLNYQDLKNFFFSKLNFYLLSCQHLPRSKQCQMFPHSVDRCETAIYSRTSLPAPHSNFPRF